MGYMGFGLNKWVYKQRPRKFFSKERKPIGDTLPKHNTGGVFNNDNPQLTGRLNEQQTAEEIAEKQFTRRTNIVYRIIIYLALFAFTLFVIMNYNSSKESRQAAAQARFDMIKEREQQEKARSYQLIFDYGMNNLNQQDYKRAIKEFEHFITLQPHSIKGKEALANALYHYCMEENMDCKKALVQYKKLNQLTSKIFYQQRTVEIYMHLGMYEKADSVLNEMNN